jgi:hypothetical protein
VLSDFKPKTPKMNAIVLLMAVVLMWIAVIVGLYQRIFKMPKWFEDPPASFERIRRQSKGAKKFWIPLSLLFIISLLVSLILNWQYTIVRSYLFASLACFGLTGALSGMYFVKEVLAFSNMPVTAPKTPDLINRTRFWLRWTTVRDILQLLAAIFVTLADTHL